MQYEKYNVCCNNKSTDRTNRWRVLFLHCLGRNVIADDVKYIAHEASKFYVVIDYECQIDSYQMSMKQLSVVFRKSALYLILGKCVINIYFINAYYHVWFIHDFRITIFRRILYMVQLLNALFSSYVPYVFHISNDLLLTKNQYTTMEYEYKLLITNHLISSSSNSTLFNTYMMKTLYVIQIDMLMNNNLICLNIFCEHML